MEATLKGRRRDRKQLVAADEGRLDEVLAELVEAHDLTPLSKPERWEPVQPDSTAYAPGLERLWSSTARGSKPGAGPECHTLDGVRWVEAPRQPYVPEGHEPNAGVRDTYRPHPVTERGTVPDHDHAPWEALADEIYDLPEGFLVEVILDYRIEPDSLAEALVGVFGDDLNIAYFGRENLLSIPLRDVMASHGQPMDAGVLALVVDACVPRGVSVCLMREYRSICEASGGMAVVVSNDGRTDGTATPWNLSSTLHGGRYYAHMRYRVELERDVVSAVDIIKDERHGRHGRRLWPTLHVEAAAAAIDGLLDGLLDD